MTLTICEFNLEVGMMEAAAVTGARLDTHAIRSAVDCAAGVVHRNGANYEYPVLDDAARIGLPGEFVRLVEPETESDPVALLIQFLVAAGNAIGRSAHFEVEAAQHYCNLFAVAVGATAAARKGTSWSHVRRAMERCTDWNSRCIKNGGLSSGEGVIHAVRDPLQSREPVKEKGRFTGDYQELETDPGIADKRLLIYAPEFSQALKVASREANILSEVLRAAWETGDLHTLNKNSPETATGAHISIAAHVTKAELLSLLAEADCANGLANRFLWCCVRRSKELPDGGNVDPAALVDLQARIAAAVDRARGLGRLRWSPAAHQIWRGVYSELSRPKPGLLGAVISRAEAQTVRLAVLYAALDGVTEIAPSHLQAALAVWDYCESSAKFVFGGRLGNPAADKIFDALRAKGGLTRTEIQQLFDRNLPQSDIAAALEFLRAEGLALSESKPSGGRPVELWRPVCISSKVTK